MAAGRRTRAGLGASLRSPLAPPRLANFDRVPARVIAEDLERLFSCEQIYPTIVKYAVVACARHGAGALECQDGVVAIQDGSVAIRVRQEGLLFGFARKQIGATAMNRAPTNIARHPTVALFAKRYWTNAVQPQW